jgi:hypothetical protein
MIMMSSNDEVIKRNRNKHFSDNTDQQDSKEAESAKTAGMDLTQVGNVSKDILDITQTPDVATWNKGTQIKSNAESTIKKPEERVEGITLGKVTPTNTTTIELKEKEYGQLIIDPADKEEVSKVVNSGASLTDKAEERFSTSDINLPNMSKRYHEKAK